MEVKICSNCKIEKSFLDFHKCSVRKDGRVSICKTCKSKKAANLYKHDYHKSRKNWLKCQYGLSTERFLEMYNNQNGKCKICEVFLELGGGRKTGPVIDHDHVSGKIRGLLCPRCNMMLGLALDNTITLSRAITYLKENT